MPEPKLERSFTLSVVKRHESQQKKVKNRFLSVARLAKSNFCVLYFSVVGDSVFFNCSHLLACNQVVTVGPDQARLTSLI